MRYKPYQNSVCDTLSITSATATDIYHKSVQASIRWHLTLAPELKGAYYNNSKPRGDSKGCDASAELLNPHPISKNASSGLPMNAKFQTTNGTAA